MKNSLKIFGLSVILSIASISVFADNSVKNYVESEDIIISEGKIYLQTEEDNLEPLSALYSDEKGLYILTDHSNQSAEQETMYTFRELTAGYECVNGHINPRYRKTCKECGKPVIH